MEHNKRKKSKKMIHPLVHQGPFFGPIEHRQTPTKIWKIGNTCNIVRCTRDSFRGVWLSEVVTSYEVAPWDKPGIGKTSLVSARKVKFANLQHECGNMFCLQATPWWMLPSTGPMSAFLTSFPPKSILTNMFEKKMFFYAPHIWEILQKLLNKSNRRKMWDKSENTLDQFIFCTFILTISMAVYTSPNHHEHSRPNHCRTFSVPFPRFQVENIRQEVKLSLPNVVVNM